MFYSSFKEFAHLPNTVEEIEDMIHEEKAKADCNRQTDPKVFYTNFPVTEDFIYALQ